MSGWEGFFYGAVGGGLGELLGLFRLRHEVGQALPAYLRSWFYWIVTIGMIGAGGVLVVVYIKSGITLQPIIAVNVGASAPLLIAALIAQTPKINID